jgi:opine dehydrogenase
MGSKMKFAVLGSGNGARALSAQIAAKGYPLVMWEPLEENEDIQKLMKTPHLRLEGDINISGTLEGVTRNIEEALRETRVILIVVPSFAHIPIFTQMIPYLQDGQQVILIPGNFSAYRLKKMMADAGCKKDISLSTTETMPYACRISSFDTVKIFKRKFVMHLATSPANAGKEILDLLNDIFDDYIKYIPVEHILVQDISNLNYVMHPYPILLNYGQIELKPETFRHYMDGVTPLISEQMELLDHERMRIGEKIGFHLTSVLELLKLYYGQNDSKTIYEYINSRETPYADLVGQSINSRYITEDVPGLVLPTALLAKKIGVSSPRADTIVNLSSQLHNIDYWATGTTLESIGIGNKNIHEIIDIMT